ncbi:MAG TPA: hypothetical protein VE177_03110, partial [Candidatus Binatus sp.]|nr:hypothetical protein [Candidatus Binatus sp.]
DMNAFDPAGSIPFIDIANSSGIHYVIANQNHAGAQFSPSVLSGLNWTQIGSQLDNPSSNVALSIDGAADIIISAICRADGGQPTSVCSNSYAQIQQAPFAQGLMAPFDLQVILQRVVEGSTNWKDLL